MEKALGTYLGKLSNMVGGIFHGAYEDPESQEDQELINCVKHAMEEWNQAEKFFESVSEPDLIDYAIYRIEASKKRYMYLLKKAKEKGVKVDCC
ncbi:MAG: YaaL family protein [Clostridia bacterium]